ncbi:MAG: nuclear transport factor 2 family protein [Beijerinckiaceae bacterium]
MRKTLAIAVAAAWMAVATPTRADVRDEILATYDRFVMAQNARDLARVREVLLDDPRFLWVSDGKSVWGRDALVARMSAFQKLEVWRVEPLLARAEVVEVSSDVAYLHMPLDLFLGTKEAPSTTRFLVSILCRRTPQGWRIAALFTTLDNP